MGSVACIVVCLDVQHIYTLLYMHRYAEISIGGIDGFYSMHSCLS